jgi:hypothetical protein
MDRYPRFAWDTALEYVKCDPKGTELCPNRMKPVETLVEVRSGTDVQIVRQKWA